MRWVRQSCGFPFIITSANKPALAAAHRTGIQYHGFPRTPEASARVNGENGISGSTDGRGGPERLKHCTESGCHTPPQPHDAGAARVPAVLLARQARGMHVRWHQGAQLRGIRVRHALGMRMCARRGGRTAAHEPCSASSRQLYFRYRTPILAIILVPTSSQERRDERESYASPARLDRSCTCDVTTDAGRPTALAASSTASCRAGQLGELPCAVRCELYAYGARATTQGSRCKPVTVYRRATATRH